MLGRRLGLIAAVSVVVVSVAGCNAGALSRRELVVHFNPAATSAQHKAALDACSHVTPEASPEPFSTTGPVSNQINNVRFRIDHANDRDIALLTTCLSKQPGVVGEDIPDLSN